jgi:23S rRNA (uridine2552-2'-O)-methyltransferase
MSPKLTGIKEADRWAAVGLLELALWASGKLLKPVGSFVAKAFKSNESEEFYRNARLSFNKLTREQLKSSRKTSTEFYIVGLGFKK